MAFDKCEGLLIDARMQFMQRAWVQQCRPKAVSIQAIAKMNMGISISIKARCTILKAMVGKPWFAIAVHNSIMRRKQD